MSAPRCASPHDHAGAAAFFAALGVELPPGAGNRQVRCFAAPERHSSGDRNPSCSVNVDTGAWQCFGCGAHGGAYDAALAVGYSTTEAADLVKRHELWRGDADPRPPRQPEGTGRTAKRTRQPAPLPAFGQLDAWAEALQHRADVLDHARRRKGWSPSALAVLGVGWDGERFTLPIRNAAGDLVNVVRYLPGAKPKSRALAGRPRDLFPAPERLRTEAPELFAPGRPAPEVWIVEGEGDAIAAQSANPRLYAFSVPGGNGWRSEWAHRFTGTDVTVLCDHDAQGDALAYRVTGDLVTAGVTVRTLTWPTVTGRTDLAPGFDLSDWSAELHGVAA